MIDAPQGKQPIEEILNIIDSRKYDNQFQSLE
jgi:hypothetical protein